MTVDMMVDTIDGETVVTGKCGYEVEYTIRNGKMTIRYTGGSEWTGVMMRSKGWDFESNEEGDGNCSSITPWERYGVEVKEIELYGVSDILKSAFEGCKAEKVTIHGDVFLVGSRAFAYCENLKTVEFTGNVKIISNEAFRGCSKLEYVNLSNVVYIMVDAFSECPKLGSERALTMLNMDYIPVGLFSGTGVTELVIGGTMTELVDYEFSGCESLRKVTLLDSMKSIKSNAFRECESLEEVHIGKGISCIGVNAFKDCPKCKITVDVPLDSIDIASGAIDTATIESTCKEIDFDKWAQSVKQNLNAIGNVE